MFGPHKEVGVLTVARGTKILQHSGVIAAFKPNTKSVINLERKVTAFPLPLAIVTHRQIFTVTIFAYVGAFGKLQLFS